MNRHLRKGIAALLTTTVIFSGLEPFSLTKSAYADTINIDQILQKQKNTLKDDEPNYKQGEAIILYSTSTSYDELSKASANEDYTFENTWTFEDANLSNDSDLSYSSNLSSDISVSLVKSETLTTNELISELKDQPGVIATEPNYFIKVYDLPDDPLIKNQWAISNTGQNGGTADDDTNVDAIWNSGITGTTATPDEPVIAIIDTGVDYTHPDLTNNMWNNPYPDQLPGTCGYDFCDNDADPMDEHSHGTHCAGTLGAEANSSGIVGVNQSAKIMALRIFDANGNGQLADTVAAYNYIYRAQKLGVNIISINNSWGYAAGDDNNDISSILTECIELAGRNGAISVCAAGNDSANLEGSCCYPATCDSEYVISVAASNENDELASFSNYGKTQADIAAPGTDILSTINTECFNPSIYDVNKLNSLCHTYKSFSSENDIDDISIKDGTLSIDKTHFFGDESENAASVAWTIDAKAGKTYYLRIPYSYAASETNPFISAMISGHGDIIVSDKIAQLFQNDSLYGEILVFDVASGEKVGSDDYSDILGAYSNNNYWNHISFESTDANSSTTQNRDFVLAFTSFGDGKYTINIDDFAISKENTASTEFGKYNFYNGTSMAAPFVTASAALLYSKYYSELKDLSGIERTLALKDKILSSCRLSDNLKDKCATGGTLDLSKTDFPQPIITSLTNDNDGNFTITGRHFIIGDKYPQLTVNGKTIDAEYSDTNITFTDTSLLNRSNTISLTTVNGSASYEYFSYIMSNYFEPQLATDFSLSSASPKNLFSDGNSLYLYDEESKSVLQYFDSHIMSGMDYTLDDQDLSDDPESDIPFDNPYDFSQWQTCFSINTDTVFYDMNPVELYNTTLDLSGISFRNNHFIALAVLNHNASNGSTLYSDSYIIDYDMTNCLWTYHSLPSDMAKLKNVSFGTYNGSLILTGGYNESNDSFSTKTMILPSDASISDADAWINGPELPFGKAGAKMLQTGKKLVLTGGAAASSNEANKNIIYDGTSWTTSATVLEPVTPENITLGSKEYAYANLSPSLCKEGLVYFTTGNYQGLGNIFIYNLQKDSFEPTGYYFTDSSDYSSLMSASVGDSLYIMGYTPPAEDDFFIFSNNSYANEEYWDGSNTIGFFKAHINSGLVNVSSKDSKKGFISGTGLYLPGDIVTLTAQPAEGYYPISLSVNGKTYKDCTATLVVTDKIEASAKYGKYVSNISIKNSKKMYLSSGSTAKLSYTISNATNKNVTFKSSNSKYVSVNSKGVITAKAAGEGKSAVITIKAADGSGVKASIKVYVIKKIKRISANCASSLKAGATAVITTTTTPSSVNPVLLTYKSSNSKYASVSSKGIVTAKKAGIGKTVTITVSSSINPSIKTYVKIKITK